MPVDNEEEDEDDPAFRLVRKIEELLPPPARLRVDAPAAPKTEKAVAEFARRGIEAEVKLRLSYADAKGKATERMVWPLEVDVAVVADVLVAWCEMRRDFRQFRLDRIGAISATEERMPRRRRILLAEWRAKQDETGW